ncbi:phosphoribosylanthranilate isomerase [Luteolibacter pohnpeiensis]|uniref:N-(5'-phosphoribosyl)anthranilate isomerase n=1 Tax=Luteolibacter pohnpeiensis TaxID=454153 RepID=A0A934SCA0_9BACT|nr:phosphoribosylanthranilate isomerase [Luteolibacter pohnpeiensis]MBK1883269.1 phosphoribosylanthranilate isomerase [Luteolibacter pohnpeiensis]
MTQFERFFDPSTVSLKICGVTRLADAEQLVALGVDALGVNFWPKSKRYLAPEKAAWLGFLRGKILRVGVFVNENSDTALRLVQDGLLDVVQLHGDESPADAKPFRDAGVPFIKAIGIKTRDDLALATDYGAAGLLLDAHAPGVYGGTGETFDWDVARSFREQNPGLPVLLAGGIVPENAALAAQSVSPAALDIASGAEISPGIKDFQKVTALLTAIRF